MREDTAETAAAYDGTTILLHWLTASLVALQWVGAHYIDAFPRGPLRVDARSIHIVVGLGLVAIVLTRLAWRRSRGRRLAPPPVNPLIRFASAAMHPILYALMIAVLCAGVANAWIRGDSLFNLWSIPSLKPGDKALRALAGDVHEQLANILLIAAGLHALAGIVHGVVLKDGVLARMWPRRRPA